MPFKEPPVSIAIVVASYILSATVKFEIVRLFGVIAKFEPTKLTS